MFDGKILRGLTGTPMRRMARAKSSLADADPEPFTLANLMTKSLMPSISLFTSEFPRLSGCWAIDQAALRFGLRQPGPARVISTRYFCMSQAPVGQRSAHSPQ